MPPLVRTVGISKHYPSGGTIIRAVSNVSLSIEHGEFVAIRGRSGSGKSTLMNLLGLLERADSGEYALKAREVAKLSEDTRAAIRSQDIGFIFQLPALLPRATALENVELPLVYAGVPRSDRSRRSCAATDHPARWANHRGRRGIRQEFASERHHLGFSSMSPLESLRIATRALRVNKLRSALTVLGIVVGVAAVVCMVSVGAGAQAEVSEKIRTLGANLLLVMPGARNSGGARLESGTQPTLTEEDAAAIRRELVDAQVAAPLLSRSMPLVAANKNWVTLVAGINADYLVAREWQVANGRSFTGDEITSGAKVAIVGSVIIEELFDGRAGVGETFRIGNVPFTVIGVLDRKGLGAAGRSQDDVVFIPLSTAKSRVLGAVRGTTREALDFI